MEIDTQPTTMSESEVWLETLSLTEMKKSEESILDDGDRHSTHDYVRVGKGLF